MHRRLLTTAALALFAGAGVAQADVIVDPQLWIGPPGSTSPPGGTAIGNESNLITGTGSGSSFVAGVAGNHTMQSPTLLIVGLDGPAGAGGVKIGFSGCPTTGCPTANPGTYGLGANTGTLNATNFHDAYAALGIADAGGGNSESFTNWNSADQLNGFPVPTSYTLEAFSIPAAITASNFLSLSEVGLPAGSFLILYSCEAPDPTLAACSGGSVGSTPFTNAGLITTSSGGPTPPPPPPPPVLPEPSALVILGTAVLGLIGWGRIRKPTDPAA